MKRLILTLSLFVAILGVAPLHADNRTSSPEYLAFEATFDVEKVLSRAMVDENAQVYDISVIVTTDDPRIVERRTQPVIEVSPGVWKFLGSEIANYTTPPAVLDAKALLYAGRQALITLRDANVPIPAAATEALPLVVNESEWHGRIISKYKVRKDQASVAGVPGSVISIWLEVEGGLDDKISVFIWVDASGQYIVDPYED